MDEEGVPPTKRAKKDRQTLEKTLLGAIENFESKHGQCDVPFFVGDLDKAKESVFKWRRLIPRVELFYAVKCCDDPPLLKYLADLGTSFDCASQKEIETILALGVDPSRIIFSHTIKPVSSLKYADEKKIDLMTFDNRDELDKIKKWSPSARLLIRIRCEPSEHALYNFGMKFGCPLSEVRQLLVKAKKDNLNVVGVQFHVGSFLTNTSAFNDAIRNAKSAFDTADKIGFKFDILDIGGGFIDNDNVINFVKMAENLNANLETYFPEKEGVRVIGEPGRFLANPVYTWVVKIIGKRSNESLEKGIVIHKEKEMLVAPRFIYYVNDGEWGSKPYNMDAGIKLRAFTKGIFGETSYPSTVFGPTCSPDLVHSDVSLPEQNIGDYLYASCAGAYSITLASDFNMMPRRNVIYITET